MNKCTFTLADGFHTCGSYAINESKDPNLCDVHYYKTLAREAGEALVRWENNDQSFGAHAAGALAKLRAAGLLKGGE